MPSHTYTPQDEIRAWRRRSAELALSCAGSTPADEVVRLRELSILLATAPAGLACGLAAPEPRELEAMAQTGAALIVCLRLIEAAEGGYLLSCGGGHMASVALPGSEDEVTASGDTPALAMIGALALALSESADAQMFPGDLALPSGARLN